MNQDKFEICILGSANSDHFLEVQNFPKEGETIAAKKSYIKNGGKGANQAVASALLGSLSVFAGQVGKDELGLRLIVEMEKSGLHLEGLRKVDEETGQAIILLNQQGENLIIIVHGANGSYDQFLSLPKEYLDVVGRSDFLQVQMEIPQEINLLASQIMHQNDKFVMLDCGGKAEKLKEEFMNCLTFISPNETELERIIGEELNIDQDNIEDYLEKVINQKLFTKYPQLFVLLKLGANGSMLVTNNYRVRCQSVTQYNKQILNDYKIVDTVGAGDCFTSAFCSEFYRELSKQAYVRVSVFRKIEEEKQKEIFMKAMKFASASAFLCITRHGAMPSMPRLESVNEFMQKYL